MSKILIMSIVVLCCFGAGAFSSEFYVAPNGSDLNKGTIKNPFASLEAARNAIREIKKNKGLPKEGVTVWIRGGVYKRLKTFELNEQDSGTERSPVIYRNYGNEKAALLGGEQLDVSAFQPVVDSNILNRIISEKARKKVLQIDLKSLGIIDYGQHKQFGFSQNVLPAPIEFFFNDEPMTLARYPDKSTMLIGDVIDSGSAPRYGDFSKRAGIFTYTDDRHAKWVNVDDVWLSGVFHYGWSDDNIKVASIDLNSKQVTLNAASLYGVKKIGDFNRYYAFNLLEEISVPGEWYVDRKTGILYFWPPSDIKKSKITVSILEEPMIAMEGVSYVTIRGLTLEVMRGMGLYIERGRDNVIAGCTMRNIGTIAILMGQGVENSDGPILSYDGKHVSRHIGNLQAHIYYDPTWDRKAGENHSIISCDIYNTGSGGVYLSGGSKKNLTPGNCSVVNCRIYNYQRRYKFLWSGINVDGCGNRVAHNEIFDADYQGIYVHGNEHIFEYNNIHHVAQDSFDTSPWYLGRDPSDRGNIIRYNFFHHTGRSDNMTMGIYFDDGACGVTVHGNIFYKVASHGVVYSNGGQDIVVSNNIFVRCDTPAVWMHSYWYEIDPKTLSYFFGKNSIYRRRLSKLINVKQPPYSTRYPDLTDFMDIIENADYFGMRPRHNIMEKNVIYDCAQKLKLVGQYAQFHEINNYETKIDPGFVDMANLNFKLRDDSVIFKKIPGFENIPFERIGLYLDEYRTSLP